MPHLQDDIQEGWWLTVEYKTGEVTVFALDDKPLSLSPLRERFGREGSELEMVSEMVMNLGWGARLNAAGYIDCTEWLGVYRTHDEAAAALDESFGTRCCYCGERVGAGNADAPCDGCVDSVQGLCVDGLFCTNDKVIADQTWTARWADKWPCSTLSGKWVTFAYDDETGVTFDDCEGDREFIDSHEAQAMADDVHDIVREHYEEVVA